MRPRVTAVRDGESVSARLRGARLSRQARVGKALLVAVLSTLIALVSHVLAGGAVPEAPGILVPLAFSTFACLPLSGRVLSLPRLVLSVLVSQLLFHWLFVLGASGQGVLPIEDAPAGHAGHHLQTITMLHTGTEMASHMDHSDGDGWMWVGHGIAAVVTILLIRRGEAALVGLWQLAMLLVRTLFPRLPRPDAIRVVLPRLSGGFLSRRPFSHRLLGASISRRGPPRSVLLALS
ncbi:MAG: hypothetical protein EAS51_12610 [Microbacteriaceae bacterium]|nr:MAG: hypothetical protein EAS51_12610 [Microbacteriaceae bacterium]